MGKALRKTRPLRDTRLQGFAAWVLGLFGWTVEAVPPPEQKCVVIFYPHTSNWDFVIGIVARSAIWLPIQWAGKDTLFRWPLGGVFRWLGGIPVNRRERTGLTARLTEEFAQRKRFYLAITPEGTRSRTDRWKSGFYHLALAAQVPLGLAYIDYPRKRVGIGGYLELTGNEAADLEALRRFYADKTGKHPEHQGEIRFVH
jgi:1-acyl-sn-glycerol-3-phosphate acyltransferase